MDVCTMWKAKDVIYKKIYVEIDICSKRGNTDEKNVEVLFMVVLGFPIPSFKVKYYWNFTNMGVII